MTAATLLTSRFFHTLLATCTVAAGLTVGAVSHAGAITIYSALEEEELHLFAEKAREEIPHITLNILRLSTGNMAMRLIAEANNPQADVILSLPVSNVLNPNIAPLFAPYTPKGIEQIPARFRDPDGHWFSMAGYMQVFCVNTQRLKRLKLPVPQSWADLADPKYKGEVVMPDPVSSGVGYVNLTTLVQGLGEERGWDFIARLTQNMAQYTNSGSRPCRMAQAGEYAVGVSYEVPAIQAISEGYPMQLVVPTDWPGYEISGIGMLKGAKNPTDAQAFLDWLLTPSPMAIYASLKPVITYPRPGGQPASERAAGLPEDMTSIMPNMDFAAMARNRTALIARWKEVTQR